MKTNPPADRRGFTIVEMLLYMGLLTMLITVITRIFVATTDVQLVSEAVGAVEEDSRFIYSRFSYDLGQADSIVTPGVAGEESDTLTILIDGIATTYGMSGTGLVLARNTDIDALNSVRTRITDLKFLRLGNSSDKESVQMQFTISSATQGIKGPDTKQMETTITIR